MLCDVCGRNFNDASNLRRHKLTHNEAGKSFQCGHCDKAFARSDHLKKHAQAMHGVREDAIKATNDVDLTEYKCPKCDKSYAHKPSLQRHMLSHERVERRQSQEAQVIDSGAEVMECGEMFTGEEVPQECVVRDEVTANTGVVNEEERVVDECFEGDVEGHHNLTCPKCDENCTTYIRLRQHLVDEHDYRLDIEQQDFKSLDEFWIWKESMEKEFCSFVNRRGVRSLKSGKKYYFDCHRSGVFTSKGTGKKFRQADKQTCKIGSVCPATIHLPVSDSGVHMEWSKEHFGHECDINFLKLTATERNFIADRLKNGTSFDVIG